MGHSSHNGTLHEPIHRALPHTDSPHNGTLHEPIHHGLPHTSAPASAKTSSRAHFLPFPHLSPTLFSRPYGHIHVYDHAYDNSNAPAYDHT